eukprot:453030_1
MSFSQQPRNLNTTRQDLVQNHIESFNFLFKSQQSPGCLDLIIKNLPHYTIDSPYIPDKPIWKYYIKHIKVEKPYKNDASALDKRLFPAECRQRMITYSAPLLATLVWEYTGDNGTKIEEFDINFGEMPIMLRSNKCHLNGLSSKKLIRAHEDENELGGYFISNGNERVIRMVISERRNQLFCVNRATFKQRHDKYTEFGLLIRCVRNDEAMNQNVIHYVDDGSATIEFTIGSAIYLMPVILLLRALKPTTDREIYNSIMQGTHKEEKNLFLSERVELMLHQSKELPCRTQKGCMAFIGEKFRKFYPYLSIHAPAEEIGQELLKNCILIHCPTNEEKFNLLTLGIRKLYAFVEGKLVAQKIDVATDCHEVVTSGHLIASIIRMGLLQYLQSIHNNCIRYFGKNSNNPDGIVYDSSIIFETLINPQKISGGQIGDRLCYFMNTGNLPYSDRSYKQKSGWCITADRINYFRFLSHFRAVHRGAFWTEMRTTVVRKLRPECWGFLCPVHTPDGTPCGLLNHLAEPASIISHYYFDKNSREDFVHTLLSIGLLPLDSVTGEISGGIPVLLDGIFIGYMSCEIASDFVLNLRKFKIKRKHNVPQTLSIAAVFDCDIKIWPEITLSTLPGRMVRPVQHLKYNKIEWITPAEQIYMDIAVIKSEIKPFHTHLEISAQSILSLLAGCTPFSDNNQSPRNMYQCQMLKQAMGLFAINMDYRSDNKAYRLQYPQTPITQNDVYKKYNLNDYACGTNAVVAVISYTGYDMEDAMIICKESMERGFKHGFVYVTKIIDLTTHQTQLGELHLHLRNISNIHSATLYNSNFNEYGLPLIGAIILQNEPLYILYNDIKKDFTEIRYRKSEACIIEQIRIIRTHKNEFNVEEPIIVSIKLRYNRFPIIGDKFASRAGQKGTLAQLWPQRDMPFTSDGIVPDLIINPHAFPSRMTIGMLLESMASKVGALNGEYYDSTPFKFDEENRAVDHFGGKLLSAGYNYYGSEQMYSGVTGVAMIAEIYIGLVYYQRLRHMISDKYQVRALGPVNNLTKQPLKGRKRRGGIRLGEMERDSIISHGCAYLLHDRLFHNSDGEIRWMCKKCKGFISVFDNPKYQKKWCKICNNGDNLTRINVPHVFAYLTNELAAMNVKLNLTVKE